MSSNRQDLPASLGRASRKPADGLSDLWTREPYPSGPGWPLAAFLAAFWPMLGEGVRGIGTSAPSSPLPYQPLVRSWLEAGRRWLGTPFVPIPLGGRGAQRRARAAPLGAGTGAACSHAQARLRAEHGEHGDDLPLARSEHRGTVAPTRVIHRAELSTAQSSISS